MEELLLKILGPGGPAETGAAGRLKKGVCGASINAAFLTALCGPAHPFYGRARDLLQEASSHPEWR
ncbi:MAG: hypothetical protein ACLFUP_03600, partial [Desulfobacteraceae bacterium]